MSTVGATTAGSIITAAQQRADMTNSSFISDSEWLSMANRSCQQLWDKLCEAYGNDYEVASAWNFTTTGTSDTVALPDGSTVTDSISNAVAAPFYKLLGVDLQLSNSATSTTGWITLRRFNFADRNKYTLPNVQTLWGRTNLLYRLRGNYLWFIPLPAANMALRAWYMPRFTPFTSTSDTFDGINGWEEWAINDMAIKARIKEETDVGPLMQLQAAQEERLTKLMENRDAGSPATVTDVSGINGGNYGGWGGDWGM